MDPIDRIGTSKRETDRLAFVIYQQLRPLPAEDKQFVLNGVKRAPRVDAGRALLVEGAIERFEKSCGTRISKRRYEEWRVNTDDRSLPSASFIAGTYGGTWSKAMDALGKQPALEHSAFRLRALGKSPDKDEAIEDLKRCAAELEIDSLSLAIYSEWARKKQPHAPLGKVYLLSRDPFIRRFGSFNRALHEAGLQPSKTSNGPWGGQGRYSKRGAIQALQAAQAAVDPEFPLTQQQFHDWRAGEYEKARAAGEWLAIPSYLTVRKLLGNWPLALVAAGLISKECGDHYALGRGRRMSDEQMATGFLRSGEILGEDFTKAEYDRWIQTEREIVTQIRPPSSSLLCLRLGGWGPAKSALNAARSGEEPIGFMVLIIQQRRRASGR